ncbi:MAG: XRE family transcriptional regulator [Candidatus Cloacimonetes bacterium]|nr:XRE family transcriptional regulator [Candidatus Cloacimonadota bacterium]
MSVQATGVAQRLKSLRIKLSVTQKVFAKLLDCSQAKISDYESGKLSISNADLAKIADAYKVNLNWLLTGKGNMFQLLETLDPSVLGKTIRLPIVGEIAAGQPCEVLENTYLGHIDLPIGFLHYPPPYHVFRVAGQSMEPFLMSGDIVVCSGDWRDIDINGKVMAFRTWEGITIKRLVEDSQHRTSWLMPFNHGYSPVPYDEDSDEITMIGILDVAIRSFNL